MKRIFIVLLTLLVLLCGCMTASDLPPLGRRLKKFRSQLLKRNRRHISSLLPLTETVTQKRSIRPLQILKSVRTVM